jgi:hypothetical protein
MSVTPKDHCIEDHAVRLMVLHQEIGNVGEDQGEDNHQLESKEHLRLGSVGSFQRREAFKSKQDGKKHDDPGEKEKITKCRINMQNGKMRKKLQQDVLKSAKSAQTQERKH